MRFYPIISLFLVLFLAINISQAQLFDPVANNDVASTNENAPVAIDVTANDTDLDPLGVDPSTVDLDLSQSGIQSIVSTPDGNYSADAAGIVTFTPTIGFSGSTSASYTINDRFFGTPSNVATITINVNGIPDAFDDTGFTNQNESTSLNVISNDTDDGNIDVATVDLDTSSPGIQTSNTAAGGSFTVDGSGLVQFAPDLGFSGIATLLYTVNDDLGATSNTATITVEVNSPPTAQDDNSSTNEEVAVQLNILSNDTDSDGTIASATVDLDTSSPGIQSNNAIAAGSFTVDNSGIVTFTPVTGFSGPAVLTYTVNDDDDARSNPATITITVNDKPAANGDNINTTEDQPTALNITSNDTDSNGINTASVDLDPASSGIQSVFTTASGNNLSVDGAGMVTLTPAADFNGAESVTYTVQDDLGATSDPATININISPVNDPPMIIGQTPSPLTIDEDEAIAVDFAHLQVTDVDNTYPGGFTLDVQGGANYSVSGNIVTPATDFEGTLTVSVVVNDGSDDSPVFPLVIEVTGENDAPTINAQAVTININEDTPFTVLPSHLQITDPDPGSSFTIILSAGANYTFANDIITPAANYNGSLTIPVQVSDGTATSNTFNLQITVDAVNDAPVIDNQQILSTAEDQNITLELANLLVSDIDNAYPTGFSLSVGAGSNYSFSGTTVIPAPNFNGTLTVPVQVSDGTTSSAAFDLQIEVTPVNDAPVIDAQPSALSTNEETPFTILTTHLTISDPDIGSNFSLVISPGANYTFSGNTITPVSNFTGTLTVPVQVSDGSLTSLSFDMTIGVTAVNDAPTIDGQLVLTTSEDDDITIELTDLVVTDADDAYPSGFSLLLAAGSNYTFSGTTITPTPDFNGTLTVPVQVNDGDASSLSFNLQIGVTPVNDPPVVIGQASGLSTAEDASFAILTSHLTIADIDNSTGFSVIALAGSNYTFSGNTITPSQDFTGQLTVPIQVYDGTDYSPTFNFQLDVSGSNDAPSITGQVVLSTSEESPLTILVSHLTISDPDNSGGFMVNVLSGSNYTLEGSTITPAVNFNGTLSVPVQVSDGSSSSSIFNLQVQVTPTNDAPSITDQVSLNTNEETSLTIGPSFLTISDPDNTSFTVTVFQGSNYTRSGTTITPVSNFNGLLTIPIRVSDGSATSSTFNLKVQVNPVNDPPVITGQTSISTLEETPLALLVSHLVISDPDNTSGFSINVSSGSNYTFTGTTITPAINFTGTLNVNITVSDGSLTSAPFTAQITVNNANDPPVITGQTSLSIDEETPLTIGVAHLVISDPDNNSGFSVSVSAGSNYTFSGTTITPSINFNGTLSVPVRVSDGTSSSNLYNLQIQVRPVNDVPVIIGQTLLSTTEDTPITLLVSNLTISDPDNSAGFTLTVSPGTNYTFSGTTITPATDFNGTLNIGVSVNDGVNNSTTFIVQVQVGDANDPPVITGQVPLSINEDQSLTIQLSDLIVTDPDNTYPNGFTITTAPGANYTASGSRVTPDQNFFGIIVVPVRVNDGINNSALFNLQITVNSVNDNPGFDVIPNQQVLENSGTHNVTITNISKGNGESTQQLVFFASSGNTNIISDPVVTYDGAASTAVLTFSTATNVSGVVAITVSVVDNGTPPASFTSTFQIEVIEINNPPTLDEIQNLTIQEDAPQHTIALSGITSGGGESQTIAITAYIDKPELLASDLVLSYQSPGTTANLQINPKPDISGTAQVTVTVSDNGSNVSPNNNTTSRTFTLTIQPVNDIPVFKSTPVVTAAVNEPYSYAIEAADVENESITIEVPSKPAWATFASTGNGKGTLSGIPSSAGLNPVTLIAKDFSEVPVSQSYSLLVNTRPVLKTIAVTTLEDQRTAIPLLTGFSDAEGSALEDAVIVKKPGHGILKLLNKNINQGDTLSASSVNIMAYEPNADFYGTDTIRYNASDGTHFSLTDAYIVITISPVNDPPVITALENDTLKFEVDNTPALITTVFDFEDHDDEIFVEANIVFASETYRSEYDVLLFQNTDKITGVYNAEIGSLKLSGAATREAYIEAIRSIQYNYLNTVSPVLETKSVNVTLTDGENQSAAKERLITLIYTFTDLKIPTGFTPNGDRINDTWVIAQPDKAFEKAVVKVFNKKGTTVYESSGFENPWDGTHNGELLPPDSYYFTIDLNLPNKKVYKGFVTLLR